MKIFAAFRKYVQLTFRKYLQLTLRKYFRSGSFRGSSSGGSDRVVIRKIFTV